MSEPVGGPEPNMQATAPLAEKEPGRRSLLVMLAVFAALTLVVVCISLVAKALAKSGQNGASSTASAPDPEVVAFLGPLATGEPFAGFRITRVDSSTHGRITLEIAGEGIDRLTVDIHAKSASSPTPIAETGVLAIYARTGRGGAQTSNAIQKACAALADALVLREEAGHEPPSLDPLTPAAPPPI